MAMHQGESTGSVQVQPHGSYSGGGGGGSSPSCGAGVVTGSADAGLLIGGNGLGVTPVDEDAGALAASAGSVDAGDGGLASSWLASCPSPTSTLDSAFPLGPCSGAVIASILTVLSSNGMPLVNTQFPGTLPVDVAVSPDGSLIAAVAPGNAFGNNQPTVFVFSSCGKGAWSRALPDEGSQPIAVAFDAANDLVVQTREPARLTIFAGSTDLTARAAISNLRSVALSTLSRADTGFDVFHTQAGGAIACASCHLEGGDDGNVWLFDSDKRRTASLRGTIAGTAPYHWTGNEPTFNALVDDVYAVRMSGLALDATLMNVLDAWVERLPAPPRRAGSTPPRPRAAKTLFEGSAGAAPPAIGLEAHQQPDDGRGNGRDVPGASAPRRRLAGALPPRRLRSHASSPTAPASARPRAPGRRRA